MANQNSPKTQQDFIDSAESIKSVIANQGLDYIVYMWSAKLDISMGGASENVGAGDVLVALSRIAAAFNINPDALAATMKEFTAQEQKRG